MTEYKAFTNDYLRQVISSHFAKQNKRLTNLQTAKKEKLLEIIDKYNIDVPEQPKRDIRKTEGEPYEIKKEGKTNILIYKDKEYKIGYKFITCTVHHNCAGSPIDTEYGKICNITPKQVHYINDDGKTYRTNTYKFINLYLQGYNHDMYID
jgi:hypothetical protein